MQHGTPPNLGALFFFAVFVIKHTQIRYSCRNNKNNTTMATYTVKREIERLEERIKNLKALVANPNNGLGMDDTENDFSSRLELGRVSWINKNDGQTYLASV